MCALCYSEIGSRPGLDPGLGVGLGESGIMTAHSGRCVDSADDCSVCQSISQELKDARVQVRESTFFVGFGVSLGSGSEKALEVPEQ